VAVGALGGKNAFSYGDDSLCGERKETGKADPTPPLPPLNNEDDAPLAPCTYREVMNAHVLFLVFMDAFS